MLIADKNPDAPPLVGISSNEPRNPVALIFLQSSGIKTPADLRSLPLLRTTEEEEWPIWFAAAGVKAVDVIRGPIFDSTMKGSSARQWM